MQQHLRTAFAAIDRIAERHADFFTDVVPHTRPEAGPRTGSGRPSPTLRTP
jgi:hypothetical protein